MRLGNGILETVGFQNVRYAGTDSCFVEAFPRRAQEDQGVGLFRRQVHHGLQRGQLIMPAGQENDVSPGESLQGLNGRIRIGGLRIIVIRHATDRRHVLDAVFHAPERQEHLADVFNGYARKEPAADGRQHVFLVMAAKNPQFAAVADLVNLAVPLQEEGPVPQVGAFGQDHFPAEVAQAGFGVASPHADFFVVGIENRQFPRRLFTENVSFAPRVLFHGSVTLQMIWCQVQHGGDVGMEIQDRFELETGQFRRRPVVFAQAFHLDAQGQPDIAAHDRLARQGFQHLSHQGRRRRLAVRSRNRDHMAGIASPGHFHFAHDFDALPARFLQEGKRIGHGRRQDDLLYFGQDLFGMPRNKPAAALLQQRRQGRFQFLRPVVIQKDPLALAGQHARRPAAADAGSHHQDGRNGTGRFFLFFSE